MHLDVQVAEEFAGQVDCGLLNKIMGRAMENEARPGMFEIGIVIVDDAAIRELNRQYRGIDQPTDVLSFPLQESANQSVIFVNPPGNVVNLGDIVISLPKAEAQAREYGHSFERELCYLAVHGLFHLLGYDHATEEDRERMRGKEESALVDLPR